MSKIIIFSNTAESLLNFRGPLLTTLARAGHQVTAMAADSRADLIARIEALGARYQAVGVDRISVNPLQDIRLLATLTRLLRRLQPDLILNCTTKAVIYGSLGAHMAGVPRICSMISGLGYVFTGTGVKYQLLRRIVIGLYRQSLKANRCIFFQNPDDQQLFTHLGLVRDTSRCFLINGSGVDLSHYQATPPGPNMPTFLLVARLLKQKGIFEYVAAAEQVKARYPDCRFQLLGPYDSRSDGVRVTDIRHWVARGTLEYLGEAQDVRPHIAAASVFVLPSYREGTPRAVLEAMAMSRAVITTDTPGCRETVISGKNGFLVPVGNAEVLAKAMEKFVVQPDLATRMGASSRQFAEEKFDVNRVNATILQGMGLVVPETG